MGSKSKGNKPDLQRVIELQSFLHTFHNIDRVIHYSDSTDKRETDTEHSYSLALIVWYLAQYFPELDTNTCIRLALVHDLVEIYAGDTFTFGDKAMIDSKAERERLALQKFEKEWPDFKELTADIHEYEDLKTPESCFVYALDKLVPIFVIYLGKGRTWQEYNITFQDLKVNKKYTATKSPQILEYYEALFKLLESHPDYFPSKK